MASAATCTASNATTCVASEAYGSGSSYSGFEYEYEASITNSSPDEPLQLPFQDATTYTSMVALGALMLLIRYSRSRVIEPALARLGRRLGERTHGAQWVKEHQEQMENFTSFSFRLLYRCVVCGLGLYEFYQNPSYWYDTKQLWIDYPNHVVTNTVQIVYLLQLAYHLEDLGGVVLEGNSRKRSDFGAMIVHHMATVSLLYGSSMTGLQRVGVVISTLHAITDVPKDFTQLAKQLEWKWVKRAGFVSLLTSWVVARVILFPFKYVPSVAFEAREHVVIPDGGLSDRGLDFFIAMLCVLVILNGMWCHMLVKLVIRVLSEGDTVTADPMLTKDASTVGKDTKPSSAEKKLIDDDHHTVVDDHDDIVSTSSLTGSDTGSDYSSETCSGNSLDSESDHEIAS